MPLAVEKASELESAVPSRRARGPSQHVTDKVMQATLAVLIESGSDGLKIERIAERSGIHKTTIYRRWGDVRGLVKAAIAAVDMEAIALADTGTLKGDIYGLARSFAEHFQKPAIIAINRLIAGSRDSDHQLTAWMDEYWQSRHTLYRKAIEAAINRGEISYPERFTMVIEMLVGPMLLRTIMTEQRLDSVFVDQLALSAYQYLSS